MVSFPQVSPPEPCAHLSSPPYAPHAPPISFFSILPPAQYWARRKTYKSYDKSFYFRTYRFCLHVALFIFIKPSTIFTESSFLPFVHKAVVIPGISRMFCQTRFRCVDRKQQQRLMEEHPHTDICRNYTLCVSPTQFTFARTAGAVRGPCRKRRYNNAYSIGHDLSTQLTGNMLHATWWYVVRGDIPNCFFGSFHCKAEIEGRRSCKPLTDMRRLTTEIRSDKCVVRRFRRCANVIQCTYTNLDSTV